MRGSLRQAARLGLCAALAGCVVRQEVGLQNNPQPERVSAVTTRDGRTVTFATPGMRVEGDTLYAAGQGEQIRIPLDSVQHVWTTKTHRARTALAIAGVAAGLGIIAAGIAWENAWH